MKTGSTLSRTETAIVARLKRGAYPEPVHKHRAIVRLKNRRIIRVAVLETRGGTRRFLALA